MRLWRFSGRGSSLSRESERMELRMVALSSGEEGWSQGGKQRK